MTFQRNPNLTLPKLPKGLDRKTPEGRAAWAEYQREYQRQRKLLAPEEYAQTVRDRHRKAQDGGQNAIRQRRANVRRRAVLDAIKAHAGCKDCGGRFPPECMDFDHLADKEFTIGVNMRKDFAKILDEILKCDIVCANCHRTRTRSRLNPTPYVEPRFTEDHVGRVLDVMQMARDRGLLP